MFHKLISKVKEWWYSKPTDQTEIDSKEISLKNAPKLENDEDNSSQLRSSIVSSFIEGLKVAMATMLSIFVPQFCAETGTTCTLQENFTNLTLFNEFVIAFNFITLGFFVWTAIIQNQREAYFISHLEESKDHPYNSLFVNLKNYPRISRRVQEYNKKLYIMSYITMIFFVLNVLFSSILIYNFFYDGFRSITTLIANVLLVSSRLFSIFDTTKQCREYKFMALSTIHQRPVSYNMIDEKYSIEPKTIGKYEMNIKIDAKQLKKMQRTNSIARMRSQSLPPLNKK